jgi:trans-aconitate methyltransferase
MSVYDEKFYADRQRGSLNSAQRVVELLQKYLTPRSVIDVGCGTGAWLSVWQRHGVTEIRGVDGDYVDRRSLLIPQERFVAYDLTVPYSEPTQYDLAMSLEVAEHLPPAVGPAFVETLTKLSPIVLFSAAIPYQIGTQHINMRWQSYWAELFGERGYVPIDCLRRALWDDPQVETWYAQNALLYVREDVLAHHPRLAEERASGRGMPLNVVHPSLSTMLAENGDVECMRVRRAVQLVHETIQSRIRRRLPRYRR